MLPNDNEKGSADHGGLADHQVTDETESPLPCYLSRRKRVGSLSLLVGCVECSVQLGLRSATVEESKHEDRLIDRRGEAVLVAILDEV
jgi:hypothetical protein